MGSGFFFMPDITLINNQRSVQDLDLIKEHLPESDKGSI